MSDFLNSYALVIGINDYSNGISPLKTPANDATEIARILEIQHHYTVNLLLDRASNLSQFRQVLEIELPKQIKEGDRFLFYFAGHGIALNGEDGPEGYLVPQDARLGNVSTYFPMSEVNRALLQLPCRHFLGILDCCFAGAFRWSSTRKAIPMELGTLHRERYDRFIQDPAWQVVTSAAYDQSAWDAFDLKDDRGQKGTHSPFACALIEALEGKADACPPAEPGKPAGDGVITASELYLYLRDRIEAATEARAIRQTPGIHYLNKHDKGEYIFLTPGHALNLPPAPPLDGSKNPYRGLLPFEEQHSDLFFGRKALTQKLYEFVTSHSLTVVLGASGSGKSSVVKAGLIPKLRGCKNGNPWLILPPFRPGESPFKALNNTLGAANLPAIATPSEATSSNVLTASESLANWFKGHPQANLVLTIDQFEELITLCHNDQERQKFLEALAEAIATYPNQLHLVLTLRSDFEPQFRNTALEKDWQTARFVVPAMTREELRQAIEEPASARVMYFDPHELVEQLIDEVANMPGALPLLSFALSELYLKYLKRQEDAKNRGETIERAITQVDYEELGGVTRSLTQRADREYEELINQDPAFSQTIRHLMLRMITVGGELARRQVPLPELEYPEPENGRIKTVIKHFEDARLLTSGTDSEGQPYEEPAHDALVRGWQKLLGWKQQDLPNILLQLSLNPIAKEWASSSKKGNFCGLLWDDDPRLPQVKAQLKLDPYWLNQQETSFVQDSLKRKKNKLIRLTITSFAVNAIILGFAAFALWNQNQAQRQQVNNALIQSAEYLSEQQQLKALESAIKAGERIKKDKILMAKINPNFASFFNRELEMQAISILQRIGYQITQSNRWQAHTAPITTVTFDPKNGQTIASASEDGSIKIWNQDGSLLPKQTLNGQGKAVWSLSISPDGSTLISGSRDGKIRLWSKDSTDKFKLQSDLTFDEQHRHKSNILAVAFSPDGTVIASSGEDAKVSLWNKNGTWLRDLNNSQYKHKDAVYSISFSPNGSEIVTAGKDGIKLWKIDGSFVKNIFILAKNTWSYGIAYSPDGSYIASGLSDGAIKLWKSDGTFIQDLTGHSNGVRGISFSPDSSQIVSAGQDQTVRLWDVKTRTLITTFEGHTGDVRSVSFNADGSLIASAGADNTIQIWKTEPILKNQVLLGHTDVVYAVDFSDDGLWVATASADNNVRVWQRNSKGIYERNFQLLEGHHNRIYSLAFSPDNSTIASADEDGQILLWQRNKIGNFSRAKAPQPENLKYQIRGIAFNSDGSEMASTSSDKKVRIWKKQNDGSYKIFQPLLSTATPENPSAYGLKVTFSPDNQILAIAHEDGTVKLWKKQMNGQFETKPFDSLSGHMGNVNQVAFSSDSSLLASAGSDGRIQVWQRNSQGNYQFKNYFEGHNGGVYSLAFHPNGQMIASADQDYTVKLWDLESNQPITLLEHTNRVLGVAFSTDGKTLASVGWDKKLILWNLDFLDLERLLEKSCEWSKGYLQHSNFVNRSEQKLCFDKAQ